MATSRTNSDALGYYHSDPEGLGGIRADLELCPLQAFINTPIGPVIIQNVTPNNGEGTGTIEAASTSTLTYTAPGDTVGSAVSLAANTSALLESGTASKAVRVYRDSVYNANVLGGVMTLDLTRQYNNAIAGDDTDEDGGDWYGCFYIYNHSDADITSITIAPAELGTAVTTDGAQLGATGAGTVTTTGSLADWPTSGWALIKTNAPATREVVYYTSRTGTSLTVPAAGRALLGTTAAAGANTDTVTPIAPVRVWAETPAAGVVQTIADHTTEPTSPTWTLAETVATLTPGSERAIWIHRDVPAGCTVEIEQLSGLDIGFTYGGTGYTHTAYGMFRIADTTLEGYELYIGEDTAPTYSAATATSSTLPFSQALSVSTTSYYVTRYRNAYNLTSFNTLSRFTTTGSGGEDETIVYTDPTVVSIDSVPGGEVDIVLNYNAATDTNIADYFRLYITTDGTTPDPNTDTPADTAIAITGFGAASYTQRITLGPYDYGTVVKIIPRVYDSVNDDESANVSVTTETVDTQVPVVPNWLNAFVGTFKGRGRIAFDDTTYYNDPTNTVGIQTLAGETVMFGASEAWRAVLGNENAFRTGITFSNVAHSASGTASPVEVVDANTFYINVNGIRRAKIDLTAGTIEAATFVFQEVAIALPVIGPTYMTSTETYIQVLNGITGRWTPALKVDSSGVLTTTAEVLQETA